MTVTKEAYNAYKAREAVWAAYIAVRKAYVANDLEDEVLAEACSLLSECYEILDEHTSDLLNADEDEE